MLFVASASVALAAALRCPIISFEELTYQSFTSLKETCLFFLDAFKIFFLLLFSFSYFFPDVSEGGFI